MKLEKERGEEQGVTEEMFGNIATETGSGTSSSSIDSDNVRWDVKGRRIRRRC